MPRRSKETVRKHEHRKLSVCAAVNAGERAELLVAFRRAGYDNPSAASREILFAWARGELVRTPATMLPQPIDGIRADLERQGKL